VKYLKADAVSAEMVSALEIQLLFLNFLDNLNLHVKNLKKRVLMVQFLSPCAVSCLDSSAFVNAVPKKYLFVIDLK
jgi:hypothetical protein